MVAVTINRKFDDKLAMWGTVGTSRFWDWETPAQVHAEVRRRIPELAPEGLLLTPAYDIDFALFDNIVAFVEAVEEFGRI
jgi:uroporphyrinogen decarboxylase